MMPAVGKGKKKDTAEENEYEAKRQWWLPLKHMIVWMQLGVPSSGSAMIVSHLVRQLLVRAYLVLIYSTEHVPGLQIFSCELTVARVWYFQSHSRPVIHSHFSDRLLIDRLYF
jgi:hypothetical protein